MLASIGESAASGPESLLVSVLFFVLAVMGLWFAGSVLLRWAYSLGQVPEQFRRGENGQSASDDKRDR